MEAATQNLKKALSLSDCSTTISDGEHQQEFVQSIGEATSENHEELNQSMRLQLEKLKEYPHGQSLIVRKIKQLGFDSGDVLKEHFEQYGPVAEVLVAHSITKPSSKRTKGRVRPATIGFVVMGSLEGADAAIAAGEQQMIKATTT